jgi:hypothetical protein
MRSVVERASKMTTKTDKEKILKDHGLHDMKVTGQHHLWIWELTTQSLALSMGLSIL